MFYAVQFRSMQSAIHHVLVFDDEEMANRYFTFMKDSEEIPETNFYHDRHDEIDLLEIHYKNPPQKYRGEKLRYVNENDYVPDVYNF